MAKTVARPETVETVTTTETAVQNNFWDKYSKPIIYVGSAFIIAVGAWFGYKEFIQKPKETKANEMIFAAENLFDKMATAGFSKDSSVVVLNGGTLGEQNVTGVLKVASEYGGTGAGNRARYIAGATYLHLKEFDKAISHLKEFDANGATQVESKAYLMLGHAYAEQNKTGEALDAYKKAANVNKKDEGITADALLMAASYAGATGKADEAKKLFNELKGNFPLHNSVRSGEVDKYLARLGELK